jgi:hypothetical protein
VALSPLGVVDCDDAVCDDWSLLAGCGWASAGKESKNATNNATTARFFIFNILRGGASGCALRLRSSSALHAMRGRDRDLVRPWKTGHVVRMIHRWVPHFSRVSTNFIRLQTCRPALTRRWAKNQNLQRRTLRKADFTALSIY